MVELDTQIRAGRVLRRIAAALAITAVVAGCARHAASDRPPERGDVAVAKVDGATIWKSDVNREAVAQGLIGEGEPLDISTDAFRRVLDEVVDQKLLAAEALKRRLDRDPIAQRRLAAARERILGDMVVEGAVNRAVTENAIRALYQEQVKLTKPAESIHARQILVATQAEGDAIRKLLAAGAQFEPLALEKSTDAATRFNGGDLGYFTTDVMPVYAAALKGAKIGDIVGPFQTDGGWAVLKVEDRRQVQPISLEEARPQIVRFLTYDEVRELLERLRNGRKVEILIKPPQVVPGAPREPASAPPPSASPSVPADVARRAGALIAPPGASGVSSALRPSEAPAKPVSPRPPSPNAAKPQADKSKP